MDSCSGGGSLSGLLWDHCGLHRDRDSLSCNLAAGRRFFCSFGSSCPNLSEISGSDAYVDSRIHGDAVCVGRSGGSDGFDSESLGGFLQLRSQIWIMSLSLEPR